MSPGTHAAAVVADQVPAWLLLQIEAEMDTAQHCTAHDAKQKAAARTQYFEGAKKDFMAQQTVLAHWKRSNGHHFSQSTSVMIVIESIIAMSCSSASCKNLSHAGTLRTMC